jgi:aspartyl-tRNA(Asn)/glutamyl-tRNA(Gln) amidotransferase subunit C
MALTPDDVKRVARLARIAVNDAEADAVLAHMGGIFELIEQMKTVDVSDVEPMAHAQDLALRLRDDVVTEPDQRELLLSLAPRSEAGLYLVPRVIE